MIQKSIHFLYRSTCKLNGKYYVGIHSTNDMNSTHTKNYFGSGDHLRNAVKPYGRENFIREILCFGPTRDYITALETRFVDQALIDDPLCMNNALGGLGGAPGVPKTKEHIAKIAAKNRGRKMTDEQRANCTKSQLESYANGRVIWNKGLGEYKGKYDGFARTCANHDLKRKKFLEEMKLSE